MRKRVLCLLLATVVLASRPAMADPLVITSGNFVLDIEGDMFTFNGDGFSLSTTALFIYSPKLSPGRCDPSGSAFEFCAEAEGAITDWSFHTTGTEQLLGTGNAVIDGVDATDVDILGSIRFDVVPTPLSSGGTRDFEFVAPFSFEGTLRGLQDGEELFARQFIGNGHVNVNYEGTLTDGVFAAHDDTIRYDFAAPVPEPGTLLLLGSGLTAAVLRRRRREA